MQVKQTYSGKALRQDIPASLRDSWRWLCASQQSGGISLTPPPLLRARCLAAPHSSSRPPCGHAPGRGVTKVLAQEAVLL